MIDKRSGELPVYDRDVPADQEIPKVDVINLDKVERYIAFHFDEFDYDFKNDKVSAEEKKIREVKIIQAVCEVLDLSPDDSVVPKYLEAILKQLKKGISFESAKQFRVGGAVMKDARANQIRALKRGGI